MLKLLIMVHCCAAGEYIAAEKLEVDFASCDLVEQIWVYGNSYEVGPVLPIANGLLCIVYCLLLCVLCCLLTPPMGPKVQKT